MPEEKIDKQEIDSIKINDQVFKVGYDAYVAYDFISHISPIKAFIKNGIVIVSLYHKLVQYFEEGGYLRDVETDKQYLFKTFFAPKNLEIRYKNSGIYEECNDFQNRFLEKVGANESIS